MFALRVLLLRSAWILVALTHLHTAWPLPGKDTMLEQAKVLAYPAILLAARSVETSKSNTTADPSVLREADLATGTTGELCAETNFTNIFTGA
jgi:hypothetical protein